MNKTLKLLFFFISLVILGSCISEKQVSTIHFGGKIINPKSNFVLLYSQGEIIDSLFLDTDDKFIGKYSDLDEGLFSFKHGDEHQFVYMQPSDSILIRLNTWDFDETLVFSGKGADKNNILIDWFVEGEKEGKNLALNKMFQLESPLFKAKMDSLLNIRTQKIADFKAKNEELPEFYFKVLDVFVNYPIYTRFEEYPRYFKHFHKDNKYPTPSNDFYSFRKKININNDSLKYLGPFTSYISYRLYNNVYSQGIEFGSKKFTKSLLNTIDKNLTDEELKNTFLYEMLVRSFINTSTCNLNKKDFFTYFNLSTNIEDKKQVQRIINDVKAMHGGKKLPNFQVTDYLNTDRNIKAITKNKNSAIFFWNPKYISKHRLINRMRELNKMFPKLNVVLIKIAQVETDYINGIDIKKQYYLNPSSSANLFLSSKLPRTFLVNRKGLIVNGYANFSSYKFNKQVKKLQKH